MATRNPRKAPTYTVRFPWKNLNSSPFKPQTWHVVAPEAMNRSRLLRVDE